MSRNESAYGITTVSQAIGASTVVQTGGEAYVLDTIIAGVTGGAVYVSGLSTAVGGSIIASGIEVYSGSVPLSLGASKVFMAAGAAATVQILKKLTSGSGA